MTINLLFLLQAQAMALTIADAFKLAYDYYEKGKTKGKGNEESSQVAQDDNKENAQQPRPVVTNGHADIYATPSTAKAPTSTPPTIEVTSDSSSSAVEDSGRKLQALVMQ